MSEGYNVRLVTKNLFWLLAENAIYLGATHWADALCHATTRVRDLYGSLEITLLFALNTVSVTFICLYCHCLASNRRLQSRGSCSPCGASVLLDRTIPLDTLNQA